MKKKTHLLVTAAILGALFCNAQNKSFSLGIGPSVGIPFNSNYSTPLGLSIKPQFEINKLSSVFGDVTYFRAKSAGQPLKFNVSIVNIKAGYKSYIKSSSGLFILTDAGLSVESYNSNGKDTFNFNRNNNYSFIAGGGIGYSFRLKNNSFIDLIPTVNYVTNPRSISRFWGIINIAYRFNFKAKTSKY